MFSSLPPYFPGYVESDEFFRPGLGSRVHFSTSDLYYRAIRDPDEIPDAAYFGSLEHGNFFQNCPPSSTVPADASLRQAPLSLYSRHGLFPVRDPHSWALRYAQIISSLVAETLPNLLD